MLQYFNANKHKRKKAVDTVSSGKLSKSDTEVDTEAPPKSRPVSIREKWSERDAFLGDRGRSDPRREKDNERSRKNEERESSRKRESRKPERSKKATEIEEEIDDEEADQRKMTEIQDWIEARKVARDIEIARATIEEQKTSKNSTSSATCKPSNKDTARQERG